MKKEDFRYILDFLSDLRENNNRDYFNENKERYLEAKGRFETFVSEMIDALSVFDAGVSSLKPKDCVYRIYRDIRFSPNKMPYKTYMGAYIAPRGGRKSILGGYYVHVEPGGSLLGGGIYCPEPAVLKKIRHGIYGSFDELNDVVSNEKFKNSVTVYSKEILKKNPAGFEAGFEGEEWLRRKEFQALHFLDDDFWMKDDAKQKILDFFKTIKPFNDYFNDIIQEND